MTAHPDSPRLRVWDDREFDALQRVAETGTVRALRFWGRFGIQVAVMPSVATTARWARPCRWSELDRALGTVQR